MFSFSFDKLLLRVYSLRRFYFSLWQSGAREDRLVSPSAPLCASLGSKVINAVCTYKSVFFAALWALVFGFWKVIALVAPYAGIKGREHVGGFSYPEMAQTRQLRSTGLLHGLLRARSDVFHPFAPWAQSENFSDLVLTYLPRLQACELYGKPTQRALCEEFLNWLAEVMHGQHSREQWQEVLLGVGSLKLDEFSDSEKYKVFSAWQVLQEMLEGTNEQDE